MAELDFGDGIQGNASWTFEGKVADTFDSHVSKSVPFYREGHSIIAGLSDFFLRESSSRSLDIGCSTGTLVNALARRHPQTVSMGIDSVKEMIAFARDKTNVPNANFICEDFIEAEFEAESFNLIISYYTAQFIHPSSRHLFFEKIFKLLKWGGALVLFEKIRGPDARFQDIMSSLYFDYKRDQGYSNDELCNKAIGLRGVLEPFSEKGNRALLERAGFEDIGPIFQWVNFQGFLAIK